MRSDVQHDELTAAIAEARLIDNSATAINNIAPKLANLLAVVQDWKADRAGTSELLRRVTDINPDAGNYNVALRLVSEDIANQIFKARKALERIEELLNTRAT